MTQFTWRDVASPDFSGAAKGFTEAGRLLQDTIGKASNGIEAFDKSQDTLAAEQLKMFIAKNQDPAALQAGFNAGSLGGMDLVGDPRMARAALAQLNPGAIDALVKSQRDRTLNTQTFDQGQALNGLGQLRTAREFANRSGDLAKVAEIDAQIEAGSGGLGWDNSGIVISDVTRGNTTGDRAQGQAAVALNELINGSGATDPADVDFLIDQSSAPDAVKAVVRAQRSSGSGNGGSGASAAIAQAAAPTNGPTNYRDAIASIESAGGGGYAAVGKATKTGDKAYGRYQVMGNNIPSWTKEALGREMSKEEFLASPQAQDAVFDHRFGGYVEKYGPQEAASRWYSGGSLADNANKTDPNGRLTVQDYVDKFSQFVGDSATRQNVNEAYGRNNANSIALEFEGALKDTRDANAVAQGLLTSEGFAGKGVDAGTMIGKIQEIRARAQKAGYPINEAVAAVILKNSVQEESLLERIAPGESLGGGRKLNFRSVDSLISQLSDGTMKTAAVNNEVMGRNESQLLLTDQRIAQAEQRVNQLKIAQRNRPNGFNPLLLARAQEDLAALQGTRNSVAAQRGSLPAAVTSTGPLSPSRGPSTTAAAKPAAPKPVAVANTKAAPLSNDAAMALAKTVYGNSNITGTLFAGPLKYKEMADNPRFNAEVRRGARLIWEDYQSNSRQ